MSADISDVLTAVHALIESPLNTASLTNDVFPYRVVLNKLVKAADVSFHGSGKEKSTTGGTRYFYDFVIRYACKFSTAEDSMQAAETQLNAVEDTIRPLLDRSQSDGLWLTASWQRSTRQDGAPGIRDVRFGASIVRFFLY